MAKKKTKITWKQIEKYRYYIMKLCKNKAEEINIMDKSITQDDVVNECMIHIFEHKDRYDTDRGGIGTFVKIKTEQQLFKLYSKARIKKKNEKEYFDEKKYLLGE